MRTHFSQQISTLLLLVCFLIPQTCNINRCSFFFFLTITALLCRNPYFSNRPLFCCSPAVQSVQIDTIWGCLLSSRPAERGVDRLLPARGGAPWRRCQGQTVDKRRGVRPARGVKVRILVQVGRVAGYGAVEPGALKVSTVRLDGGGRGGRRRRAGGGTEGGVLRWGVRRCGGAGAAATVPWAQLLRLHLRFGADVVMAPRIAT